jgi:tRNA threonylcarbamoyladenosine modification (KEOPS) complex  Pcc1 subunit
MAEQADGLVSFDLRVPMPSAHAAQIVEKSFTVDARGLSQRISAVNETLQVTIKARTHRELRNQVHSVFEQLSLILRTMAAFDDES